MDTNVETNSEVLGHEWAHAIALEDHLALKEGTLGHSGVLNLGLDDHDGLVLEEVVDENFVDAVVFEATLHNAFFEVAVETQNLNYN